MTELPAYSGLRGCPKCRAFSVKIDYHASHLTRRGCDVDDFREHLLRTCPTCGYAWAEACADAVPGDDEAEPQEEGA